MKTDDVKRWLLSYGELLNDLDRQAARIDTLRAKLECPRSAELTGMPHGNNTDPDRYADRLSRLGDLEATYQSNRESARQLYKRIDSAIRLIINPGWADRRAVLRMRYLDNELWTDIAQMIFGRQPQFEINADSYLRRCFKLHAAALEELEIHPDINNYIQEDTNDQNRN